MCKLLDCFIRWFIRDQHQQHRFMMQVQVNHAHYHLHQHRFMMQVQVKQTYYHLHCMLVQVKPAHSRPTPTYIYDVGVGKTCILPPTPTQIYDVGVGKSCTLPPTPTQIYDVGVGKTNILPPTPTYIYDVGVGETCTFATNTNIHL